MEYQAKHGLKPLEAPPELRSDPQIVRIMKVNPTKQKRPKKKASK
jgi:hypothetical protein